MLYIFHAHTGPRYDPVKPEAILRKHGVSVADAAGALEDPLAISVEDADSEGAQRFVTVGLGNAGEVLVVVWTERGGEYRPISARRPTRKERRQNEG